MNKHRLQLTDDTKSPIAMAGRLIILAMGEICPDRYVNCSAISVISRASRFSGMQMIGSALLAVRG
jgi:hypothetical protein